MPTELEPMEETEENFNENIKKLQHWKKKKQQTLSETKRTEFLNYKYNIQQKKRVIAFEKHISMGQKNQVEEILPETPSDRHP